MFKIDFSSCSYQCLDPAAGIKDGQFRCITARSAFSLKSDLPPRLHEKLAFEFQQCIEIYVSFVWDPHRFLRNTPYACLFNNESGVYAVFYRLDADQFIFISLGPGGNVAVSRLDIPECEKEIKKGDSRNWT